MTDFLATCRAAVADVQAVLAGMPVAERRRVVGRGEGGDETVAIDQAAEDAVVARLAATGEEFHLVSEELGEKRFGDDPRTWIVVDPIDGSLNAKRGIPFFALSIARASGPTMGDVDLGFVHDFGSGEEWVAERGKGAFLNGRPLDGPAPADDVEILAFEATRTDLVAERAAAMVGLAYRLRIMGSLALSLCHLAAGRVDAVCSLKAARAVDIAAGQLLVRERGYAIDLPEGVPFADAPLDVHGRSRVVAAGSVDACARLWAALSS